MITCSVGYVLHITHKARKRSMGTIGVDSSGQGHKFRYLMGEVKHCTHKVTEVDNDDVEFLLH